MNSKDLCAVDYLQDLAEAGVISFKVEGRNKTEYYASLVSRAYRKGLDIMERGEDIDLDTRNWMLQVSTTANRGFIPGFYARSAKAAAQELEKSHCVQTHLFAGKVISYDEASQVVELQVKNRMDKGDELEIVTPNQEFKFNLDEFYYGAHPEYNPHDVHEGKIKTTEHAHGGGQISL